MPITYKRISYLCFSLAMTILLMAIAGFFVGNAYALVFKALFVIFLSVSAWMYILADG